MNKPIAVGVGLLVLVLLLLFSMTFTVKYDQVAIKATFGQTDESSVITEPGLHYRLPVFIDKVSRIDTRLQLVESPDEEITTADGLQIVVRAYLLWRVDTSERGVDEGGNPIVTGPLDFFKSHGTVDGATKSLRGLFRTVFTGALGKYEFSHLIGEESSLATAETDIRDALVGALAGQGIEPVVVGISRIMLPPKTSSAVLSRMQATRNVLAEGERNTGQAEAERIRSEGNTWADKIRAFALQRAEEIRAVGELEAAKYYEEQGADEQLAIFLVQLDTLRQTLANNSTFFIPTTTGLSPFFLMNPDVLTSGDGLPHPDTEVTTDASEAKQEEAAQLVEKGP